MLTPAKSLGKFRFCTLAGVKDVRLSGAKVVGRFQDRLKEFYGPPKRRLIEDFLNWPNDTKAILRFTLRYGPLQAEPLESAEFQFFQDGWEMDQRHFQSVWEQASSFPDWQPTGGSLAFRKGWLTYTAPSLYMFLYMDLVTCEAKRLKKCRRDDCPHPYFIAGHLKQRFCCDRCAEWGQRQWKKQWWQEHGESWRAERRQQKGSKDVTRKTR